MTMTLDEALATARERGLRSLSLHVIGSGDKQYQISSKFAQSSGFHINIGPNLSEVLLAALNPPTGQLPQTQSEAPTVGLFD
jgi:hypothetical protein